MNNNPSELRDELIFKLGNFSEKLGLGKAMGQLYVALYINSEPLSLADLAQICRMSKGNASINIRRLERWGAVKKSWGHNHRRDYYQANRDILKFGAKHLTDVLQNILKEGTVLLEEANEKIESFEDRDISNSEKELIGNYRTSIKDLRLLLDNGKYLIDSIDFGDFWRPE